MNAGDLRHRVAIQKPNTATDAYGEQIAATWSTVATVSADVKPMRAAENLRARLNGMETAYTVRLRYTVEVLPDRRFLWDGHELYIDGIIDVDGRHRELHVTAFSRVEVPGG